ncbi:MAG: hypothetical protein COB02_03760 [Candidatus Cloacimonadota bacterium]|nr:MAG: hypothetical protein COB02_03760 [Candidatus Cloacimonadota bacterium]
MSQVDIILANTPYNRASIVVETAKELGLSLIYLPSSLNLIDRVWIFLKKSYASQFYPIFQDFFETVITFFK